MNKLVCETCGSTNIIKTNGLFVCQSCGVKYTAEEIKKILLTVQIDESDNLENEKNRYTELAYKCLKTGDGKAAIQYANSALAIDPRLASAWQVKMYAIECFATAGDPLVDESISTAEEYYHNSGYDDSVEEEICKSYLSRSKALFDLCYKIANDTDNLRSIHQSNARIYGWSAIDHTKQFDSPTVELCENLYKEGCKFLLEISEDVLVRNKDICFDAGMACFNCSSASRAINNRVNIYSSSVGCSSYARDTLYRKKEEADSKRKILEQERKKKAYEEYWEEHADERIQLEDEKDSLISKIAVIHKQMKENDDYKKIKAIQDRIEAAKKEIETLSIFKIKEKHRLNQLILDLNDEKNNSEKEVENKYNYQKQLSVIQNRISEIEKILKMDRG